MAAFATGEYIPIRGDDSAEYVFGHVSEAEAREAIEAQTGLSRDVQICCVRVWARWIPLPRGSECHQRIDLTSKKGRGTFPVTVVEFLYA